MVTALEAIAPHGLGPAHLPLVHIRRVRRGRETHGKYEVREFPHLLVPEKRFLPGEVSCGELPGG